MSDESANHADAVKRMQAENIAKCTADGPAIRYDYNVWVVARDDKAKQVLLGGLGLFGVGQMWFNNADGCYNDNPTYASAPQAEYPGAAMTHTLFAANFSRERAIESIN